MAALSGHKDICAFLLNNGAIPDHKQKVRFKSCGCFAAKSLIFCILLLWKIIGAGNRYSLLELNE